MKENKPHFKFMIKESKGSETNMRVEATFAKAFKMDKLSRCIYDPTIKKQWDTSMEVYEKTDLFGGASNLLMYIGYTKAKKMLNFDHRDFLEKGFHCYYNDKYYHWTSALYEVDEKGKRVMSS